MSNSEVRTLTSSVRAIVGAEVLIVDRDPSVRDGVSKLMFEAKMNATAVADPSDAWELLRSRFFSVAVVDLDTPHPNAGIETIVSMKLVSPTTSVVALTPRKSYDACVSAIRAGAIEVIHKSPESVEHLKSYVMAAAARSQSQRQLAATLDDATQTHDNFLALLMKAERRVTDLEDKVAGRDPNEVGGVLRILVVEPDGALCELLNKANIKGYTFENATTGGEALDRCSSSSFHFAMVAGELPDLPQSMVIRSLKSQSPELVALTFSGPGKGGMVAIADGGSGVPVVTDFTKLAQFTKRLPELAEAFRAKERERRYTQVFRERHYDFVRKFVSLKDKLAALASG